MVILDTTKNTQNKRNEAVLLDEWRQTSSAAPGVEVSLGQPEVAYRETVAGSDPRIYIHDTDTHTYKHAYIR